MAISIYWRMTTFHRRVVRHLDKTQVALTAEPTNNDETQAPLVPQTKKEAERAVDKLSSEIAMVQSQLSSIKRGLWFKSGGVVCSILGGILASYGSLPFAGALGTAAVNGIKDCVENGCEARGLEENLVVLQKNLADAQLTLKYD